MKSPSIFSRSSMQCRQRRQRLWQRLKQRLWQRFSASRASGALARGERARIVKYVTVTAVFFAHLLLFWGVTRVTHAPRLASFVAPVAILWTAPAASAAKNAPYFSPVETKPSVLKKAPAPLATIPALSAPRTEEIQPAQEANALTPPASEEDTHVTESLANANGKTSMSAGNTGDYDALNHDASNYPNVTAIRYREKPHPIYPPQSARAKEEGHVVVRVLIDAKGVPRRVAIAQTSGIKRLDEAALHAVAHARFFPYEEAGIASPAWAEVPITFALPNHARK